MPQKALKFFYLWTMIKLKAPLILGSQSPRRQQLLKELGLDFEVIVRSVNEYAPAEMHPRAVAVMISENKAKAFDDLSPEKIIVTADTIVALNGDVMGKPKDENDARDMLKKLSGRSHEVVSGVTVFHKGKFSSFAELTEVTFRKLSDYEIGYYIEHYEAMDKAGSYGIQDWIGKIGITRIEGDYYNVMGLPVSRLYQELLQYA